METGLDMERLSRSLGMLKRQRVFTACGIVTLSRNLALNCTRLQDDGIHAPDVEGSIQVPYGRA